MPLLLPILLALLPPAAQGTATSPPAATPRELARTLGVKELELASAARLEFWCQGSKLFRAMKKELLNSWVTAGEWLGGGDPVLPEGATFRLVILDDPEAIRAYAGVFAAEAKRLGATAPQDAFYEGVIRAGAGKWSWPPLALICARSLGDAEIRTRAVHDLAALRIGFMASEQGYGVPEFLEEGFAGLIVRRTVKKPAPLVSHDKAALASTVQGWGVFAGIGATANDHSNDPHGWPFLIRAAVKEMLRHPAESGPEHVDALLQRSHEDFARTDYAYAWAVMEFLLDDRYPIGAAAVAAREDRRWKRPKEPLPRSRRTSTLAALAKLRRQDLRTLPQSERSLLLVKALSESEGEDPGARHAAFLHWAQKVMPKK